MGEMTDDIPSPYEQYLMFNQLFHDLEECDSKRVEDFWDILDDMVLETLNWNDRKA